MDELRVVIIVFENVELLDFAGPFEAFSAVRLSDAKVPVSVTACSKEKGNIKTINGLEIIAEESIENITQADVLVIPGGEGSKKVARNDTFLRHIKRLAGASQTVLSVCTGARILAETGLLDGQNATTHHSALNELKGNHPKVNWQENVRFTDNGKYIISAGVSSGIDASLYIIKKRLGSDMSRQVAEYMEWDKK